MGRNQFNRSCDLLNPPSREELAREEQAFYEMHAGDVQWISAVKWMSTASLLLLMAWAAISEIYPPEPPAPPTPSHHALLVGSPATPFIDGPAGFVFA